MNTEAIYSALFSLVSAAPGLNKTSRRLTSFADIPVADTPALFQLQKTETAAVSTKTPAKWSIAVELVLFVNTGGLDMTVVPSTVLNPIKDAIISMFALPMHGEQTLGGLVSRCRVDGAIQIVEGVQGDTAICIIPVTLFFPE